MKKPMIGLGYREELHDEIIRHGDEIDCVEILSETFFNSKRAALLEKLLEKFHVIPHGLGLSIASTGLNMNYLNKIKRLVRIIQPCYYSDHLALTGMPGISFNCLTPIILSPEQLNIMISKINFIQDFLQIPLVLENITELLRFPSDISWAEFFQKLIDKTQCGILLDITNLYVNSFNYKFDPFFELEHWPLSSVQQIHLSGGKTVNNEKMDGHNAEIEEMSWTLFKSTISKMTNLTNVIIERDADFPPFSELLAEIKQAREILC